MIPAMPSRALARAATLSAALSVAGCGCAHRGSGSDGPSKSPDSSGPTRARAVGQTRTGRYAVLKPARFYNDPKSLAPPERPTGIAQKLYRAAAETASKLGRTAPAADRRLEAVASDLASLPLAGLPPQDLLSFMIWSRGILEPVPLTLTVATTDPTGDLAVHSVQARLMSLMANRTFQRIGVGSFRRAGSAALTVVVLLLESHIETTAVPRHLSCGKPLRFSGRVLGPFKAPSLVVLTPNGNTAHGRVEIRDGRFEAGFTFSDNAGRYQMELLSDGPTGPTVLANFPVYCGKKPPSHFALRTKTATAPAGPRKRPAASAAEAEILKLIRKQRRKAKAGPLKVLASLSTAAREHSQEMCLTGSFGHFSRRTGSADDRVRRAGLRPKVVAENVAQALSPEAAHNALMGSPSHRANILNPRLTHVGVGVSACQRPDGSYELLVTEIFVAF